MKMLKKSNIKHTVKEYAPFKVSCHQDSSPRRLIQEPPADRTCIMCADDTNNRLRNHLVFAE